MANEDEEKGSKIDVLRSIIQTYLWIDPTTKRTMCVKELKGKPWVCAKDKRTHVWIYLRDITTTCQDTGEKHL